MELTNDPFERLERFIVETQEARQQLSLKKPLNLAVLAELVGDMGRIERACLLLEALKPYIIPGTEQEILHILDEGAFKRWGDSNANQ